MRNLSNSVAPATRSLPQLGRSHNLLPDRGGLIRLIGMLSLFLITSSSLSSAQPFIPCEPGCIALQTTTSLTGNVWSNQASGVKCWDCPFEVFFTRYQKCDGTCEIVIHRIEYNEPLCAATCPNPYPPESYLLISAMEQIMTQGGLGTCDPQPGTCVTQIRITKSACWRKSYDPIKQTYLIESCANQEEVCCSDDYTMCRDAEGSPYWSWDGSHQPPTITSCDPPSSSSPWVLNECYSVCDVRVPTYPE